MATGGSSVDFKFSFWSFRPSLATTRLPIIWYNKNSTTIVPATLEERCQKVLDEMEAAPWRWSDN
jgi:hypothetical protein